MGTLKLVDPDRPRAKAPSLAVVIFVAAVLMAATLPLSSKADANDFAPHGEVVSTKPADFTPEVLDGKVEAIAPIGPDLVVVGGDFTQVRDASGVTKTLPNIFAFRRSTGLIEASFDPVLNNDVTSLIASSDDSAVYVGGFFTKVNGETNRKGLTKLDLAGDRVTTFKGRTNGRVKDIALVDDVLYVAGTFTKVVSTSVQLLAAVDATTGLPLAGVSFDFADKFSTPSASGSLSVDEIDASPDGSTVVAIGNFGTIDGQSRPRLALFDIAGPSATLSPWRTGIYANQCGPVKPQYVTDVDISPDDEYFVVVSSGGWGGGNLACDTASRFELASIGNDIQPTWTDYSGGDTYLGLAITDEAVYVGGHFRWLNNPFEAGQLAAGGVERRGFAALDPLNGLPLPFRADRSPRGVGTYEVLADDGGIWIGDDTSHINFENRPRLKYLPLDGDGPVPRPTQASLPTTIFEIDANDLTGANFDGSVLGAPSSLATGGWDTTRGMMFLGGAFFYGNTDGNLYARSFDGETIGQRTQVNLNGLEDEHFPIANLGGMYFDHDQGRIYYTVRGDSQWYYRYFTPASPIVGAVTFEAPASSAVPWAQVRGMQRIGDHLYYGRSNGNLYRIDMVGSTPTPGTRLTLSGPAIDGRDWSDGALAFYADGQLFEPTPDRAEYDFSSTGSTTSGSWQVFTFPAAPGEMIDIKLQWDDPSAALNLFLRDPLGTTIATDRSPAGSPKYLSTTASFGGTWSAAVSVKSGATDYDLLVNPFEDPPAPRAEHEFASNACDNLNSFQVFKFPVSAGDQVDISVEWDDPNAAVNAWLRDETNTKVAGNATATGSPKSISAIATSTGNWSVGVKVKSGCTTYEVLADSIGGVIPPPTPVAAWSLDGNYLDGVGTNHGAPINAPEFVNEGGTCHYAKFDGINQYVEVPYNEALNPNSFTVTLWTRVDPSTGLRSPVTSRWEEAGRLDRQGFALLSSGSDRWTFRSSRGETDHHLAGPVGMIDEWIHIAFSFEQTSIEPDGSLVGIKRFYLDGSLVAQKPGFYNPNRVAPLLIGAGGAAGNIGNIHRFAGAIDELQVFDQVLDGTEINRVRQDRPSCSPL